MALASAFTPPTTSLYQFLALAGITLFIYGEYVAINESRDVDEQKIKVISLEHSLTFTQQKYPDLPTELVYDTQGEHYQKSPEAQDALNEATLKLEEGRSELSLLRTTYWTNVIILMITSLIGIAMSFFGFIFWYSKIQIVQDAILLKQAIGTGTTESTKEESTEQSRPGEEDEDDQVKGNLT